MPIQRGNRRQLQQLIAAAAGGAAPAAPAYVTTGKDLTSLTNRYTNATGGFGPNASEGTVIISLNPQSGWDAGYRYIGYNIGDYRFVTQLTGSNAGIELQGENTSNVGTLQIKSNNVMTKGSWWAYGVSWSTVTGVAQVVINGADQLSSGGTPNTGVAIQTGTAGHQFPQHSQAGSFLSQFWADDVYLDLSDSDVWAKFYDESHKPVDLGADGSTPTGAQPFIFAPDGDLSNNLGSLANWTEVGTVANSSSSPTD